MMYESLGIMNTTLLKLVDSMVELFTYTDRLNDSERDQFIKSFQRGTFGKQEKMIKSLFNETEIRYSQFESAVNKRNQFIHEYRIYNSDNLRADAIEMYKLIRQLIKMTGAIEHLLSQAKSSKKKSTNKKQNSVKQKMDAIFKNHSYQGGLDKSRFCQLLIDKNIEPDSLNPNWDTLFRNNGYYVQGKGSGQIVRK